MCFLQRSDPTRYSELLEDLMKSVHRVRDEYPGTVSDAYELLVRTLAQIGFTNLRQRHRNFRGNYRRRNGEGFNFMQAARDNNSETHPDPVTRRDGVLKTHVLCYACQKERTLCR